MDLPFSTVRTEFSKSTSRDHFSKDPVLGLDHDLFFKSHSMRSNIFLSDGLICLELNARPSVSLGYGSWPTMMTEILLGDVLKHLNLCSFGGSTILFLSRSINFLLMLR